MSAAKMVADSTQGDSTTDGKKRKKKIKKTAGAAKAKVALPEDEDSDLDLKKELHPIGFYIKDRTSMIEEMFHSVRGASLQRALPELLKSMPLEELKDLCLEQLEVMSKKRVQRILAGEESANISSSGTDDMDDEDVDSSDEDLVGGGAGDNSGTTGGVEKVASNEDNVNDSISEKKDLIEEEEEERPGLVADSTSAVVNNSVPHTRNGDLSESSHTQQNSDKNLNTCNSGGGGTNNTQHPAIGDVYIKQEPPDSEPEQQDRVRNYRTRRGSGSDSSDSRSRSSSRSRSRSGSRHRRRRRRRGGNRRRRRRSRSSSSSSSSSSSRSRSRSRSRSGSSSEWEKASLIDGGYEDPPEAYTSGSEDGELVRKEVVPSVQVKQEVVSEAEEEKGKNGRSDDVLPLNEVAAGKSVVEGDDSADVSVSDCDNVKDSSGVKEIVGELLASVSEEKSSSIVNSGGEGDVNDNNEDAEGDEEEDDDDEEEEEDDDDGEKTVTEGGGGNEKSDGVGMDQMELLELEMRARAIKAMLMTSQQDDGSGSVNQGNQAGSSGGDGGSGNSDGNSNGDNKESDEKVEKG